MVLVIHVHVYSVMSVPSLGRCHDMFRDFFFLRFLLSFKIRPHVTFQRVKAVHT